MNTLFIVGNGFDLAHGYRTKYSDFILWYLNKVIDTYNAKGSYEDELIAIRLGSPRVRLTVQSVEEIKRFNVAINPKYKHEFIKDLISNFSDANWVDIEEEYFRHLKILYNRHLQSPILQLLKSFNGCFESLKKKLIEYLGTIDYSMYKSKYFESILLEEGVALKKGINVSERKDIIVNFNYSDTLNGYLKEFEPSSYFLVNIHGEINNPDNPIIFGYGDETVDEYQKFENLNENEFLNHFKSFGYSLSRNYSSLMESVGWGPFNLVILGHSCGLSDRVLLSEIFNNTNCQKVKLYYHKWETGDDFIDKYINISRHFKDKNKMRLTISSKPDSSPLENTYTH